MSALALAFAGGAVWAYLRLPPYLWLKDWYNRVDSSAYGPGFTPYEARDKALTPRQKAEFERLQSLGYLGSVDLARGAGVTIHDKELAYPGLNLFNDGYAPEATLMDMDGNVIHQWHFALSDAFPELKGNVPEIRQFWRRVHLFEDGSLLAIFEGHSLVKLDRDSKLLWVYSQGVHHDVEVQNDGSVYCLARRVEIIPSIHPRMPVTHDFVVILDGDGHEKRRISILDALRRSRYANLLRLAKPYGDILHTNTLEVLHGAPDSPFTPFREGNILLSFPEINTIAILDPNTEEIIWALTDLFVFQHQPTVVGGKNILIFDNLGDHGRSRVLEINPATQDLVWSWTNQDGSLRSKTNGSVQRLPNGNTLITESNQGRVIEVTEDHRIVWEYYSPHRAGEDNELIAQVFELIRLPADFPLDWAKNRPEGK